MNSNLCDITYASPNAVFGEPTVRFGTPLVPPMEPPWMIGLKKAMELALTGKFITAEEACDCGFITRVVPDDQLEEEGRKTAESIARVPPLTNYFTKKAMHHFYEMLGVEQWIEYASTLCLVGEQASIPGGNIWFAELIKEKGFREANRIMLENYGYPDEVRDKAQARQKTLGEKKDTS